MVRSQVSMSYGLGQGWQLLGQLPVDTKFLTIDYTTPDGQPYTPPYGNIHHRDETLFGLGDGRVEAQHFVRTSKAWVVGAGFGTTIPLGRTEEDPYKAAAESKTHQHMQMGSGTFDPVFSAAAVWSSHRWGSMINASGRLPLMENSKRYRPSASFEIGAGPSYRFNAKVMTTAQIALMREGQAEWSGTPDPMSGRTVLQGSASLIYRLNPMWATLVQLQSTLAQWSDADLIVQRFKGTIGLSWTPQAKARPASPR